MIYLFVSVVVSMTYLVGFSLWYVLSRGESDSDKRHT